MSGLHDDHIALTLRGISDGEYAYKGPRRVELHLTNKCNSNCIVCWKHSQHLKHKDNEYLRQELPYEVLIKLIQELSDMGVELIHLSGGGEPLLHPRFWEILSYIKRKGIACRLNTNFSLCNEGDVEKILNLGLDELIVSLWAGSEGSYMRTHPNSPKETFARIERMLKRLSDLKRTRRKISPALIIYNVICSANYREIDGMAGFAESCGADRCIFATADLIKGETDKFSLSAQEEEYAVGRLKYWIKERPGSHPDRHGFVETTSYLSQLYADKLSQDSDRGPACYAGWTFSLIEASGNVNFCCKSTREPVGNIKEDSFSAVWNSERQRRFRRCALSGNIDFKRFSSATCTKGCDNIEDNHWASRIICDSGIKHG